MFKWLFSVLLLLHVIGDFYLQTDGMARRKNQQYRHVIFHSAVYAAVFLAGSLALWSVPMLVMAFVLAVLHGAVDSLKYLYIKRGSSGKVSESALYFIDQALHIASFVIIAAFASYRGYTVVLLSWAGNILASMNITAEAFLSWACVLLIVCKPANITIKHLLSKYRPLMEDTTTNNAGGFIGSLERIIIAILLSVSQYSAIGLVLTAKSVARYDKISKDQTFAEYYLLGTLLSTLFVIVAFFVLM